MLRPEAYDTLNALNLNLFNEIWVEGMTGMPTVDACHVVPQRLVAFPKSRYKSPHGTGVHFFVEDYSFSALWRSPCRYLERIKAFECAIAPDFSIYLDMPRPMIMWQIYRRRMLAQWMQRSGLQVVYNVQTTTSEYYDAQMNGIESGGVIAMKPPLNYKRNSSGRKLFVDTIMEAQKRLHPKCFLIYGDSKISLPSNITFKIYDNDNIRIRRSDAGRKREVLAGQHGVEVRR